MELYQLRTFLAIARTGNLTRAAVILTTSQPAVSGQLRALEDELGVELFSRTSKGMELTEAGRILRAKAEEVDARASELLALAGAMAGKVAGTCRIGLNTEAGVLRVPELVDAVARSAPHMALELDRAPLAELLAGPWVWPPRDCPFHEKAMALVGAADRAALPGVTADDESTILRLVGAGVGLSLLPAFLVEEAESKGQAVPVRVSGSDIELSFVWRAQDAGSPFVRPLVEALRSIWG